MNILDFISALPAFKDAASWRAWLAFVRIVYGLPLDEEDVRLFRTHTGRQEPRQDGYAEAVAITGVQSGKTSIAAALACHAALTGARGTHALLVGQDHRGAMRALLRYAREPFEVLPAFRAEVMREAADTLELRNGVSLSAYPCRPAALRGLRACIVVVDELAFFTATDGRPVDTEMLRVARGRLATTNGKLIVLSSPYGQSGALWDLHRKHFGREESSTLIWQASAPAMNPLLPADYLERMAQDDPDAYRSEVLGEFRAGITTLLDPEALDAVIATEFRERAPMASLQYIGFCDPSGGRNDSFTAAVAHFDRSNETAVQDALRVWKAPFNPSGVVSEAATFFKSYGIARIRGDRYSAEFVAEAFRANAVSYEPSELDRSAIYLELLPLINSAKVRLLDLPEMLREFRGLERRRGTSGKDRVDHGPRGHDDQANATAGVLVYASKLRRVDLGPALEEALAFSEQMVAGHSLDEVTRRVNEFEYEAVRGRAPWDVE